MMLTKNPSNSRRMLDLLLDQQRLKSKKVQEDVERKADLKNSFDNKESLVSLLNQQRQKAKSGQAKVNPNPDYQQDCSLVHNGEKKGDEEPMEEEEVDSKCKVKSEPEQLTPAGEPIDLSDYPNKCDTSGCYRLTKETFKTVCFNGNRMLVWDSMIEESGGKLECLVCGNVAPDRHRYRHHFNRYHKDLMQDLMGTAFANNRALAKSEVKNSLYKEINDHYHLAKPFKKNHSATWDELVKQAGGDLRCLICPDYVAPNRKQFQQHYRRQHGGQDNTSKKRECDGCGQMINIDNINKHRITAKCQRMRKAMAVLGTESKGPLTKKAKAAATEDKGSVFKQTATKARKMVNATRVSSRMRKSIKYSE